jgi:peptidoglycan/xylan/chitin deacetylase (PgdA/CDA1 family)
MSRGISILMYHQVGDFPPMESHRSTYCHYRRFQRQMALLSRLRCNVLSMDAALAALRGERPLPRRSVVLTFDDGYENFYEYAFPVLERYGFPAIVYLVAGSIGRPSSWFAADGRATPPLMDARRILQLRARGVDFGSHGVSHRKLAEIDADAAREEIVESKRLLEALLGEEVRHFCYPYGSHDRATAAMVADAGYLSAVSCLRAAATGRFDPFALPRKAISYGDNGVGFLWKLLFKNAPKGTPVRLAP